jgi:hypothetical protein
MVLVISPRRRVISSASQTDRLADQRRRNSTRSRHTPFAEADIALNDAGPLAEKLYDPK